MKNQELTMESLNQQLFSQIQNLNTELKPEDVDREVSKGLAMARLGTVISNNWKTKLNMVKMIAKGDLDKGDLPEFSTKQICNPST